MANLDYSFKDIGKLIDGYASPSEFAALVVSIAENSYLNGETIRLDGGLRMPPR